MTAPTPEWSAAALVRSVATPGECGHISGIWTHGYALVCVPCLTTLAEQAFAAGQESIKHQFATAADGTKAAFESGYTAGQADERARIIAEIEGRGCACGRQIVDSLRDGPRGGA